MAKPSRFRRVLAVILWLAIPVSANSAPPLPQPSWSELTPEQQSILAPLKGEWGTLEGFRRKKWIGIANRYKSLTPEEQMRIQQRMTHWVKLSPEERNLARKKYLALKKADPEKKDQIKQKWQAYEGLPDAEKARLKAAAEKRPAPKVPLTAAKPPIPLAAQPSLSPAQSQPPGR